MSWNYRVCKEAWKLKDHEHCMLWSIRDAYYNDSGEIWAIGDSGVSIDSLDDYEDLQRELEFIKLAFARPIIDLDTIVYAKCPYDDIEDDDEEVIRLPMVSVEPEEKHNHPATAMV